EVRSISPPPWTGPSCRTSSVPSPGTTPCCWSPGTPPGATGSPRGCSTSRTADDIPPTRSPPRPRPGDRRPALPPTPPPPPTLHDPRLGASPVTEKIVLAYSGGLDTSVARGWVHDANGRATRSRAAAARQRGRD